jgi:hypothetical protein
MSQVSMDDIAMVHLALQKIDEECCRARRGSTNVSHNIIGENLNIAYDGLRRLTLAATADGASQ